MHRLPHSKAIWRLRFASLLLWINYLAFLGMVGGFGYAFWTRSPDQVRIAILIMAGFVGSVVLQWLVSLGTKCPLCMTPVLAAKNCSKNRNAKTFLGSYRLRVANNVLLRNHFRCPYCSEPTELKVRDRRSRR